MDNKIAVPFEFKSVGDLYQAPIEAVPFIVEGLLPHAGLSVLTGKPKSGKSTVARQLGAAVAKGDEFLGRTADGGTVLYLAIEEKQSEVTSHFRQLGVSESDPLLTICGAVNKQESVSRLEAALKAMPGTKLVIIDTIFKFVGGVKDSNDYMQVNNALELLQELARRYGCHILMVHHMKKRETEDPMDGALGSTAIAGAVDTYIALKTNGTGQRTISTRQRYGVDLEETQLIWNPDTRELSLGRTLEEVDREIAEATKDRIGRAIVAYVENHPGCEQTAIMNAVRGNKLTKLQIFQLLCDTGTFLRSGAGVKGEPYTYVVAPAPTPTAPAVEPIEV